VLTSRVRIWKGDGVEEEDERVSLCLALTALSLVCLATEGERNVREEIAISPWSGGAPFPPSPPPHARAAERSNFQFFPGMIPQFASLCCVIESNISRSWPCHAVLGFGFGPPG
jgi:hypothetical protein